MQPYDTILVDLDNTILDFSGSEHISLGRVFEEFGLTPTPSLFQQYHVHNHALWTRYEQGEITSADIVRDRFPSFFATLGIEADGAQAEAKFRMYLAEANLAVPGAYEVLEQLKKHCRVYVVTNGLKDSQYTRIAKAGMEKFFDGVFISGEIGYRKPERAYFEHVFQVIEGFELNKTLMVGDNLITDIGGAAAVGLDTCWFSDMPLPAESAVVPTYHIHTLSELLNIIGIAE